MKYKNHYLVLFILFSFSIPAFSYDKWYKVEVLVFENKDKNAFAEYWPLEPGKPATKNAVDIRTSNTEYSLLEDKQLMLNSTKRKLQNHYRVVLHQGWRQLLKDKEHTQSVHLIGGKQYPHSQGAQISHENESIQPSMAQYEIDGIIRFSGGKFLHIDSDFLFRKPVAFSESSGSTIKLTEILDNNWQQYPNARLQTFRLKESLRLKINEVQYLDHPLYGVIVMVSQEG